MKSNEAYKDALVYQSIRERDARRQAAVAERREVKEAEAGEQRRLRLKQSEGVVVTNLKARVKANGGICYKMHPLTDAGMPDYLIMIHGEAFFVETKSTGERCRPIQIEQHKRIYEASGMHIIVLDVAIRKLSDIWTLGYVTYECKDKMWRRSPHNPKKIKLEEWRREMGF